ncbi:MAG: hypothetical protein AB8G96_13075 [Phycisphaerales bacterium]
MSRFGSQYHVARSSGRCSATDRELEPGQAIVATLCEREDEGFDRHDFAESAWDEGARPERLFSHWRTVVAEPDDDGRQAFVDDEVLVDLFHRLSEDEREQRVAFRFVLALILMRKRLLRFVGRADAARTDKAEIWLMRQRGQDAETPSLRVVNPRLDEDDVHELTAQLGEILDGEIA